MTLKIDVAPATEPVTLAEAKSHLIVEHTEDDTLITSLIVAARLHAEALTSRQLVAATWKKYLDRFPTGNGVIELKMPPVQAVTVFDYVDTAGNTQALSASKWILDPGSEPARIAPAFGESWSAARRQLNAVEITFTAGYGNASAVPDHAKQAILLLLGHWYEHRESVGNVGTEIALAFSALIWNLRWSVHA